MGGDVTKDIVLSPGDLIGQKYRLVRRLGEGGMAAVWVAHNEALDIHVAVKFIRSDLKHPQLADRLLQEARAAARIGHPGIVRVTDFGKTKPGHPYIVMELLSGEDLGTVLERDERMDAVQAVRILLPIIDALATAHEKGIVHRDLKPENIFLTRGDDGVVRPKLVDFGIAKLEHEDFKRLTDFGMAVGSPGYMSPEQARGEDADPRSDVWSVCVVLYELATGQLPFDGDNYNALLRSVLDTEARPMVELAAGDAGLWSILSRGFIKVPDERWQSMRGLGAALAAWLIERGYTDDISGGSLSAAWLQRRLGKEEDLLSTPAPVTPPRGRRADARNTLASLSASTPISSRTVAEDDGPPPAPASVPALVAEPRSSRSPLRTLALTVVVGGALAAGAYLMWVKRPPTGPAGAASVAPALPAGALSASAKSPTTRPQTPSAHPTDAAPSASALPGFSTSAAPASAAPALSASAVPVHVPRPPRRPPRTRQHRTLDIKTTL